MRLAVMRLAEPDDLEGALVVDVMSLNLRIAAGDAGLTNENADLDSGQGESADGPLPLALRLCVVASGRGFSCRSPCPLCVIGV